MSKQQEVYGQETPGPCPYPRAQQYVGQTYNTIPAPVAVTAAIAANRSVVKEKSVLEAYLLWMVFGVLGFHHFYLNRPGFGLLYFFTFGLCGVGYLIDLFRIPHLVKEENRRLQSPEPRNPQKNVSDAYTLWFPFGLFGLHHFYLANVGLGILYFFTLGLFGIGWLVDLFRIPSMVRKTNNLSLEQKLEKSVGTTYILGVSPFGLLGFHHFYLNRPFFGMFYMFTLGNFGLGYLLDWFRIPILVKRANKNIFKGPDADRHLDDAYLLWFPFGLLGCHHFYLRRPVWGVVYFFTFGLFGIGWLVDGLRMPCLVKDCNRCLQQMTPTTPLYSGPRQGIVIAAPPQVSGLPNPPVTNPSIGPYQHTVYGGQPLPQPILQFPQQPLPGYHPPVYQYGQEQNQSAPSYMEDPPPYSQRPETSDNTSGSQMKQ